MGERSETDNTGISIAYIRIAVSYARRIVPYAFVKEEYISALMLKYAPAAIAFITAPEKYIILPYAFGIAPAVFYTRERLLPGAHGEILANHADFICNTEQYMIQ